jgi:hypothetical protein
MMFALACIGVLGSGSDRICSIGGLSTRSWHVKHRHAGYVEQSAMYIAIGLGIYQCSSAISSLALELSML